MTIERSHGKARPTLPRSSDLNDRRPPETDDKPNGQRGPGGRFAKGNAIAVGHGWRKAIRKMLGRAGEGIEQEDMRQLTRESWRVYRAFMQELPHDGAQVSSLVASRARHSVLSAHLVGLAAEAGLSTEKGMKLLELSTKFDQRAERLCVTAMDVAERLAAAERQRRTKNPHDELLAVFSEAKS
jgi:hypothetical protein